MDHLLIKAEDNALTVEDLTEHLSVNYARNNPSVVDKLTLLLLWTATHGQEMHTQIILEANADVNASPFSSKGYTALHYAASHNHAAVISLLIRAGADTSLRSKGDKKTALEIATSLNNRAAMNALANATTRTEMKKKSSVSGDCKAFWQLAYDGKLTSNLLISFLENKADVNYHPQAHPFSRGSALVFALRHDQPMIARMLIEAKANVNDADTQRNAETPLMIAIKHQLFEVIDPLLEAKANVDMKHSGSGESALHLAIRCAKTPVMSRVIVSLLKFHANPKLKNKRNQTPLMLAESMRPKTPHLVEMMNALRTLKAYHNPGSFAQYSVVKRSTIKHPNLIAVSRAISRAPVTPRAAAKQPQNGEPAVAEPVAYAAIPKQPTDPLPPLPQQPAPELEDPFASDLKAYLKQAPQVVRDYYTNFLQSASKAELQLARLGMMSSVIREGDSREGIAIGTYMAELTASQRVIQTSRQHVETTKQHWIESQAAYIRIVDDERKRVDQHRNKVTKEFPHIGWPEKITTHEEQLSQLVQHAYEDKDVHCCVVCLHEPKSVVFLPCRHMKTCKACANMLDKCPVCRSVTTEKIEIFL